MKRFTSFLLVIAMLLSMVPTVFAAENETASEETVEAVVETIADDAAERVAVTLVDDNTQWKYLDDNTDTAGDSTAEGYDRTSWTAENYDDSAWKTGVGPFGSKKGNAALETGYTAATVLDGCNGSNDTPAYFFCTTFNVESLADMAELTGTVQCDDGLIVYINGTRVAAFEDTACDANGNSLGSAITENLQYGGSNGGTPRTNTFTLTDLSVLHEGENTLAVELHQGRQTSSDLWFYMSELSVNNGVEPVPEQSNISLSVGANETQMNFTWHCTASDAGSLLIAMESKLVDGAMPAGAASYEASSAENNDGKYTNKVTVTGLTAGTTYAYQIVNGETVSEINTFTTDDGGKFSFAFVADPQIGASGTASSDGEGWDNTLNIVAENDIFSDISFVLSAGDQVNTASSESEYDLYLDHDALAGLPVATIIGNHDSSSDAYSEHFNIANNSGLGATSAGSDYWFTYNNALFLVINTNSSSVAEHLEFAQNAIAANPDAQWKIVTFHQAIYSVASHAEDSSILTLRENIAPLMKELDIDVVLMGHDHVYVRTYMMDGLEVMDDASIYDDESYSSITDPEGTLYVTANSGSGSKFYNIKSTVYPYSAVQNQEKVPNVSRVSVSDNQFTITTYRITDMSVVDTFTINRTASGETETPDEEIEVGTEIDADTQWKYLDDNTDPAGDSAAEGYDRTSWTAEDYDDSAWKTGVASFGAKNGAIGTLSGDYVPVTLLNQYKEDGTDIESFFFRAYIDVEDASAVTQIVGTLIHDDSATLYINGTRVNGWGDDGVTENLQYASNGHQDAPAVQTLAITEAEVLDLLHDGVNTIAVEIHQDRSSSSDVYFDMTLAMSTEAVELPAPEISNASLSMGADETQMNFTWHCTASDAGSLLIAMESKLVDGAMPAGAASYEASSAENNDGKYTNKVTVTGLTAGTTYAYQIVNGETVSEINTFTTDDGGKFSFAFVADPQIGASGTASSDGEGWDNTLNIVAENDIFSDISFVLSAGDQVNTASSESEYDLYLDHDALAGLPVATIIGNHDSSSDAYSEHFNVANESAEYGITNAGGDYYFVYNDVLFMVLNSNDQSAAEHKAFMEAAIAANPNVSWKIVSFHHSIYTVASHAEDSDILSRREQLVPIIDELDIDVVLMGHDHVYCRTYIMDGLNPITDASAYDDEGYSSVTNPEGTLYVTANSGSGSKFYNLKSTQYAYSAAQNQEKVPNVSKVTISDEAFTITTYRTTDMSVVDTFTINHHDHVYDQEVADEAYLASKANCTDKAKYYYSCECGEAGSETFEYGYALGHNCITTVTEPTCTEQGYTTYDCIDCDYIFNSNYTDAKGHTCVETVTGPTCTEQGYTTYTCVDCDYTVTADYVDALGHTYENGVCGICGAEDPDYVEPSEPETPDEPEDSCKLGWMDWLDKIFGSWWGDDEEDQHKHSYTCEVTEEATCTETGEMTYTCACGDSYTKVIKTTDHEYENGFCIHCGAKKPAHPGWKDFFKWFWNFG